MNKSDNCRIFESNNGMWQAAVKPCFVAAFP